MSRRARNRRDKRAEADELLGTDEDQDEGEDDAPMTLSTGERIDPRSQWPFPALNHPERKGQ